MNRYLFALGLATLVACGSSSRSWDGGSSGSGGSLADGGGPDDSTPCAAGQQIACACLGGLQGAQACKSDGSGYLACACATSVDASGAGGDLDRADMSGEAGGSLGEGGAGGAAASGAGEAGASGASEGGMPAVCSASSAAVTTAQGLAALHQLFSSAATFCLPRADDPAAGISVCTSAACGGAANTCNATLGSPTFSFDPTSSAFSVTGNLVITGAATAAAPLSDCPALQITAPGTTVTGTLNAALVPIMSPTGVEYTTSNLGVTFDAASVAGCEPTVSSALNFMLANAGVKQQIEQVVANELSAQTLTAPCTAEGG